MATGATSVALPLQCVGRVLQIPLVEAALLQSLVLYEKVKGSRGALRWALSTAELAARKAVETAAPLAASLAAPLAAPVARRLGPRVQAVDRALCKVLDAVENRAPIVMEPPEQIYKYVRSYLVSTYNQLLAARDRVTALTKLFLGKAGAMLTGSNKAASTTVIKATKPAAWILATEEHLPADGQGTEGDVYSELSFYQKLARHTRGLILASRRSVTSCQPPVETIPAVEKTPEEASDTAVSTQTPEEASDTAVSTQTS